VRKQFTSENRTDCSRILRIAGLIVPAAVCLILTLPASAGPARTIDAATLRAGAMEHHPTVVAARAAMEQALAARQGSGSWPDPDLEGRLLRKDGGDSEVEASLRFALPWSGRLAAARRAADLGLDRARLQLETARYRAAIEADRLIARLAWARSLVELHTSLALRSSEQAGLAAQRQEANLADPLEVSLVLADAARDRRALVRSRNSESAITAALRLLAGLPPGEDRIETVTLDWQPRELRREPILEMAREHGPTLADARLQMERAGEEVKQAGRARLPDLHLGPAVQREESGTSWGLAIGVPIPLFGRTRAGLQAARARHQGTEEALELENRALPVQVATLLDRLAALEEELAELNGDAATASEQAFHLAQARWTAGNLDVLHLLSAHRAFAEIRMDRLNTLLQLRETWLDLSLAVGRRLEGAHDPAATETE
jgi:outer membrane protein TolC